LFQSESSLLLEHIFIAFATNLGDLYAKHVHNKIVQNGFKWVVPVKVIKFIPKSQEFPTNDRVILEVYLPDIEICDRVFEVAKCAHINDDIYHIVHPWQNEYKFNYSNIDMKKLTSMLGVS
jgi:hypothetical protein